MSVRYIFNTSGQYVAFINEQNLFSPKSEWLGFTKNGTDFFDNRGKSLGKVLKDDRIVVSRNGIRPQNQLPPVRPFTPFVPFAPFPRLHMMTLPFDWKDVFERAPITFKNGEKVADLSHLLGSQLIAADGVFLGEVTKNRYDTNSMANSFGSYGSRYSSTSVFNPYSNYGSKYSTYSPFNNFATNPPSFVINGRVIGYLTSNPYFSNRVDTEQFFRWFGEIR